MKRILLASFAAILGLAGCAKVSTDATQVETFALRATVTPDNHCTVDALGKTYTSIGQVRGALLPTFSGTLDNGGYHSIGCWVGNPDGTDGDLVVTFSGNSYQQPFPTGTFRPTFEPAYGSSDKIAAVSFRASSYGPTALRTIEKSTGAVNVESSPTGARTITVDVSAMMNQF